jgi:transcriptional regulator with XRE-family HTH domain
MATTNIIKMLRMQHNWTQKELAFRAGIKSQSVISDIENHKHNITKTELLGLSKAFNVETQNLFRE